MSKYIVEDAKKITTKKIRQMKRDGVCISMLTSYDYSMAALVDAAGVDIILVGDSAANVMAGYSTTLPITLQEMIYHASGVVRAVKRALVVCDMPFGSYQVDRSEGIRNAVRIMAESGCDAVKLEGGEHVADTVRGIVQAGIPVMGHLGLTPQSVNEFGGYGLRAKEDAEAEKLLSDAHILQEAGCFSLVLEKIPAELTAKVCAELDIPVIGIGAGPADGQVMVIQDMLGMNGGKLPKFVRRYADLSAVITDAVGEYVSDVKGGAYPNEKEWW